MFGYNVNAFEHEPYMEFYTEFYMEFALPPESTLALQTEVLSLVFWGNHRDK